MLANHSTLWGLQAITFIKSLWKKKVVPWRTLSSVNISKCVNATFCSPSKATIFLENPQRGASGLPFMNSTTLSWPIRPRSLAFSSSFVSVWVSSEGTAASVSAFAGALSVWDKGLLTIRAFFSTDAVSAAWSAPVIRSRSVWPWITYTIFKKECSGWHDIYTHLQDYKCWNGFDIEGFCNIRLFFCLNLKRKGDHRHLRRQVLQIPHLQEKYMWMLFR